jgi:hypothetical protein
MDISRLIECAADALHVILQEVFCMYNDFDYYNSGYRQHRPPRSKDGIAKYIAIILVTSIISSTTVGVLLYNKFSAELKQAALHAMDSAQEDRQV